MSGDGSSLLTRPVLPFLRKPFAPDELLSIVTEMLRRERVSVPVPARLDAPARGPYRSPPR
jgi:hypothetical protein